jgi:hypothetical protein
MKRWIVLLFVVSSLVACRSEEGGPGAAGLVPEGGGELLPELVQEHVRDRRRMDLDQLSASIVQATDGIGWTEERSGEEVDLFVELSGTLGKPDFVQTTSEDLTASPLFQKFLTDAANSVCFKVLERDRGRAQTERVLVRHLALTDTVGSNAEGVALNMSMLLRRFHGRNLAPDSPQLNPWNWLFETAVAVGGDPAEGWRSVCVALISHPDFYSY